MSPALASRLRALRLVHPFPSFLNAALVGALAFIAGADPSRIALLALGMLGMQFAIGAANDVIDQPLDATVKPWKPIPAGLLSSCTATGVAVSAGSAGGLLSLAVGLESVVLWLAMLGCGMAYNLGLKATAFGWACFSVAFALLPVYAWHGAGGTLPPRAELLVGLAVVAGPAVQLANGLVDLERDRASGAVTLATRLGRRRSVLALAVLLLIVHGMAWATLVREPVISPALVIVAAATTAAFAGLGLSAAASISLRAAGWTLQAIALALLGLGWLAAVGAG